MKTKALSAFNFFGGKAEMSELISDMLNYSVECYIEPFGGACRTMLNKNRHNIEIYNDSSKGLCSFFNLMSKEDTSKELINRIYQTEYSAEEFRKALEYRTSYDDSPLTQMWRDFSNTLRGLCKKYGLLSQESTYSEFMAVLKNSKETSTDLYPLLTDSEKRLLKQSAKNYAEAHSAFGERKIDIQLINDEYKSEDNKFIETIRISSMDLPDIWGGEDTRDYLENYDLAVATYVSYIQSRDGMGASWSSVKYRSQDEYIRQMDRLYDVAERMYGVYVFGAEDALTFLVNRRYLDDEQVQFYLDPSYLDEEDNKKNLGKVYNQSFGYDEHEYLLQLICNAKAKILISNYDVALYNEYLTSDRGWKRYEHHTKTSLGRDKGKERIEVLWYNY